MDRRRFLTASGAAAGVAIAGSAAPRAAASSGRVAIGLLPEIEWEMPTSWPPNLDVLFGSAELFAEEVGRLTAGRFVITPRAAGELIPPLEVLPNVQSGDYPIGHTASYYYTSLGEWTAFGTGLPFGLTTRQQNAWLYDGGGLAMLQELYDRHFGVIQFPAGNTGGQMGGWFRDQISSVDDLAGLRMRIPGPGGRVMERLGVSVQQLLAAELYDALASGAIDAVEWVGPYDDLNLGFADVVQNYYYPGWWDVGPTAEVQVNRAEWDALPEQYRFALEAAAYKANQLMTARYDARNAAALATLEEAGVGVLPFPDDVIAAAREESFALYDELAAADDDFATVYESWNAFRQQVSRWFAIAEAPMLAITAPA